MIRHDQVIFHHAQLYTIDTRRMLVLQAIQEWLLHRRSSPRGRW